MVLFLAKMAEFVPSGVIEKASLHDMIYTACPRCFSSMNAQLAPNAGVEVRVQCPSCSAFSRQDQLQFKYRLKVGAIVQLFISTSFGYFKLCVIYRYQLQLLYGSTVADAMLFDEAAEALLGVPASKMKGELLSKYPSLPHLLEELLVGLRVSFSFQRQAPKRNAKHAQFTRDLKITSMEPLIPQLLPEPAVMLAINLLRQQSRGGNHLVE